MNAGSLRDATYAVVDVETTGFDPRRDRVVEVACVVMQGGLQRSSFSSLVNPGRAIPAIASAVHHLTNIDTQAAPLLEEIAPALQALCADAVVVAHNARFDLGFLPFLAHRPIVCSMRFAMHMVPDAPNFKNQVLRYHLGITGASRDVAIAHRALGDAVVTSKIFGICLNRYLAGGGSDDLAMLVATLDMPRRVGSGRAVA